MGSSFAVVLSVLSSAFASSDQIASSDSGRCLPVWRESVRFLFAMCQRRFSWPDKLQRYVFGFCICTRVPLFETSFFLLVGFI